MISQRNIRIIHSLAIKKYREHHHLFLAEGDKVITGILESAIEVEYLFATEKAFSCLGNIHKRVKEIHEIDLTEIAKISNHKSPPQCLAVCRIPDYKPFSVEEMDDLVLCLDSVQDPGNLGTIVRLADWFGIGNIICSRSTADLYNPKTVQATMGSIGHVRIHYTDLSLFLAESGQRGIPVLGTSLDGENIYTAPLPDKGIIVFGSEGKGISQDLLSLIPARITIPGYARYNRNAESLNVSVAAAIICAEFRRRTRPSPPLYSK